MKYSLKLLFACVFLFTSCLKQKESPFQKYFNPATLRIDYFHTGDAQSESVSLDEMYRYDHWAGSELNLIDPLDYGAYYHKIYDLSSGELIYSRGFDSYFKEYQTSAPALNGEVKQFHESAIVPLPKANVIFALEKRDKSGQLQEVFRTEIDPAAALQTVNDLDIHIYTSQESGPSAVKADIAIIGEGYTVEENQKFQDDLKRFTEYFFRAEPCRSNRDKIQYPWCTKTQHGQWNR
jgi:hypothetical protein